MRDHPNKPASRGFRSDPEERACAMERDGMIFTNASEVDAAKGQALERKRSGSENSPAAVRRRADEQKVT